MLGRDRVKGKAYDHGRCQTYGLEYNNWIPDMHADDADDPADAEGEHCEEGVVVWEFAVQAGARKGAYGEYFAEEYHVEHDWILHKKHEVMVAGHSEMHADSSE